MGIAEQPFPVDPTPEELDRQFGQPHHGHCNPEQLGACGENVHQHPDGKWFFWDEVQCDEYGPYDTEAECRDKLQLYCDTYLKPGPVS